MKDISREQEKINDRNERGIYFLSEKCFFDKMVKIYEDLLSIKINLNNCMFLRVWQGCGTVSCHTIVVDKNKELNSQIDKIKYIADMIISELKLNKVSKDDLIRSDWRMNLKTDKLLELDLNKEYIKIYMIASLLIVFQNHLESEPEFKAGVLINKIIEMNNKYLEEIGDDYYHERW